MNRDDVIKAINDACLNATAEKIADAIMELEKKSKKPEWEEILDIMCKSDRTCYRWEINGKPASESLKHFIRTEIIEKICEEIKEQICRSSNDIVDDIDIVKARWLKGE